MLVKVYEQPHSRQALLEQSDFPVKIPAINFISPNEKELKFSAADVDRLKSYIVD